MTFFSDDMPVTTLGDMVVMGEAPAKLMKALAVIAADLHPAIERLPDITPGISKRSCVLCSLAVRDFLQRLDIEAFVAPVVAVAMATETEGGQDKVIHSAGIGVPGTKPAPKNWNGHLVVVAPRDNYLIDTTLYQINRPAWPDLPGMLATPIVAQHRKRLWGLDVITGIGATSTTSTYEFSLAWLANPSNRAWRNGPDAGRGRRRLVVHKLVHTFGPWRDK